LHPKKTSNNCVDAERENTWVSAPTHEKRGRWF
jgi:hypothetical protein